MALQEKLCVDDLVHGDSPLSATGEKQVRFRLKTKKAAFERVHPQVVLSSPLKRAIRSALAAYPEHKIKIDPKLRELDAVVGMHKEELQKFIQNAAPERKHKVDLSAVKDTKPWWSPAESQEEAAKRMQKVLSEVQKNTLKGKKVALVAHMGVFRTMAGPLKPFPKEHWGSSRGFPRNFLPYYARIEATEAAPAVLKVVPATAEEATLVLVRHAHSRAQAAHTLRKKIEKFTPDPLKADTAKSLDNMIRKFNADRPV